MNSEQSGGRRGSQRLRARDFPGLAAAAVAAWLSAAPAGAGVPDLISYQGRLTNAAGTPVTGPTLLRFRLFLGGDGTSFPSTGALVYEETATISPASNGVFSHFIGSGVPSSSCPESPCAIDPSDFGDGAQPVWIEVTSDPDGQAGTPDDDTLLPRSRIGSGVFAYRVASLEGTTGGSVSGPLSVDSLTARTGATLGPDVTGDIVLRFDRSGNDDPTLAWNETDRRFEWSDEGFAAAGLTLGKSTAIEFAAPEVGGVVTGPIRIHTTYARFADRDGDGLGEEDGVLMLCYNCGEGGAGKEVPGEYLAKMQWEWTYQPDPVSRAIEWNFDYVSPSGTDFRPWFSYLDADDSPSFKLMVQSQPGVTAFQINQNGNSSFGGTAQPTRQLEVQGTGDLGLEGGPSGGAIDFEGPTADSNETRLLAADATADRQVELPNASGRLPVIDRSGAHWIVMAGDGRRATHDTGLEVCAAAGLVCDETYEFGSPIPGTCSAFHPNRRFQALCRP